MSKGHSDCDNGAYDGQCRSNSWITLETPVRALKGRGRRVTKRVQRYPRQIASSTGKNPRVPAIAHSTQMADTGDGSRGQEGSSLTSRRNNQGFDGCAVEQCDGAAFLFLV